MLLIAAALLLVKRLPLLLVVLELLELSWHLLVLRRSLLGDIGEHLVAIWSGLAQLLRRGLIHI